MINSEEFLKGVAEFLKSRTPEQQKEDAEKVYNRYKELFGNESRSFKEIYNEVCSRVESFKVDDEE